jgi:hypothetical protein
VGAIEVLELKGEAIRFVAQNDHFSSCRVEKEDYRAAGEDVKREKSKKGIVQWIEKKFRKELLQNSAKLSKDYCHTNVPC